MQIFPTVIILHLVAICCATISGPYLFWGHEHVVDVQPKALLEANEHDLSQIFKDVKAIVVFIRNTTQGLDGLRYPKLKKLVHSYPWAYLPQQNLAAEPFNYNANIEVVSLFGTPADESEQIIKGYNDACIIYGASEVLGILANREEEAHFLAKREAKNEEDTEQRTTTAQTPISNETDKSFIYIADGNKSMLYANSVLVLKLSQMNETLKLNEHMKHITFDDQKSKGYGRMNIIFPIENVKLFLRFNFTMKSSSWTMRAVEVEYKDNKTVLTAVGNEWSLPSAPVGFSYRCSIGEIVFSNKIDTLTIGDYQVQPWIAGNAKFSEAYDCIGSTTAPIWAGIFVAFLLFSILTVGIMAMLDLKTPNRFESSRSKQLTFTVQE